MSIESIGRTTKAPEERHRLWLPGTWRSSGACALFPGKIYEPVAPAAQKRVLYRLLTPGGQDQLIEPLPRRAPQALHPGTARRTPRTLDPAAPCGVDHGLNAQGPTDEWTSESRLARPPSALSPTATSAGEPPAQFDEGSETKTDREGLSFSPAIGSPLLN